MDHGAKVKPTIYSQAPIAQGFFFLFARFWGKPFPETPCPLRSPVHAVAAWGWDGDRIAV